MQGEARWGVECDQAAFGKIAAPTFRFLQPPALLAPVVLSGSIAPGERLSRDEPWGRWLLGCREKRLASL